MEQHVCSLESAQRLKKMGIQQKSLVYWLNVQHCVHMKVKEDGYTLQEDENGNPMIDKIDYRIELGNPMAWDIKKEDTWSAFIASELGELLPSSINEWGLTIYATSCVGQEKLINKWHIQYTDSSEQKALMKYISDLNLSTAMARMLIYLLENKLMELPQ